MNLTSVAYVSERVFFYKITVIHDAHIGLGPRPYTCIHSFSVVTNSPSNYFNSVGNSVTFSLFKIVFQ